MDNFTVSDDNCSVRQWSTTPALVVTLLTGAVAAAVWCGVLWATGAAAPGLLIAAVTASGFTGWGVFALRARPRLRADTDGVTIRGFGRPHHYPWPFVTGVRVVRVRRLGRESALLEIDTTRADGAEQLWVFGRFDLGADPDDVQLELAAVRP